MTHTIQVYEFQPLGGLPERPEGQVVAHQRAELERNAVATGELQIRNAAAGLCREGQGTRRAFAQHRA